MIETGSSDMRFVRLACPYCGERSPTVDQREDPRRSAMSDWWFDHRIKHILSPKIEIAPPPGREGLNG